MTGLRSRRRNVHLLTALWLVAVPILPAPAGAVGAPQDAPAEATEDERVEEVEEVETEESEEEPGERQPWGRAGWENDQLVFVSEDERFTMHLSNRVQVRYTSEETGPGDAGDSFEIRRYKFKMTGRIFGDWRYKLQAAMDGDSVELDDAYFVYTRSRLVQPWLGQGLVFFGRQALTSSGSLQFVERSIATRRFAPFRDVGVALVGEAGGPLLEYEVGLYNGEGVNSKSNEDGEFLTSFRAVLTPLGVYERNEIPFDYPEDPRVAVGVEGFRNKGRIRDTLSEVEVLAGEVAFKLRGFAVVGEYFSEEATFLDGELRETDGYYVDVGYLLPSKKVHVAARYSEISPGLEGPSRDRTEAGIAAGYFWKRHAYKLQGDLRRVTADSADTETDVLRLQIQFAF